MERTSLLRTAGALSAVAALAAGCGGGSSSSSSNSGSASSTPATTTAASTAPATTPTTPPKASDRLQLTADASQLRFDKQTLSATAGKVTIAMDNPSPLQHNIAITGNGVNVKGTIVGKGGVSTVVADLKPGTYTFYCSVPGHRQAGMQGTLTVR